MIYLTEIRLMGKWEFRVGGILFFFKRKREARSNCVHERLPEFSNAVIKVKDTYGPGLAIQHHPRAGKIDPWVETPATKLEYPIWALGPNW